MTFKSDYLIHACVSLECQSIASRTYGIRERERKREREKEREKERKREREKERKREREKERKKERTRKRERFEWSINLMR